MNFPPLGSPISRVALDDVSRDLFEFDVAYHGADPDAGTFATPTGHVGTFARGATLASVSDAQTIPSTQTYTAVNAQPALEQGDWDRDGVREAIGWRMASSDRLAFPARMRAGFDISGMLEFIETGAVIGTAGTTLAAYTDDAGTGDGFWFDTSGSAGGFYRFNYRSGGTVRTATLAARPSTNDCVRLFFELTAAGVATVAQSINFAAATTAAAAVLAQPASWAASASWRFNSRGTSANPGQMHFRRFRCVSGLLVQSTLIERR